MTQAPRAAPSVGNPPSGPYCAYDETEAMTGVLVCARASGGASRGDGGSRRVCLSVVNQRSTM